MIPIIGKPEPNTFYDKVRRPATDWLATHPNNLKPYWRKILPELHLAYDGICAYYAIYLEFDSGAKTCDHFKPKQKYPELAYDWQNYRLACTQANSRKHTYEDILDPFTLAADTFFIDFSDGSVFANPVLDNKTLSNVKNTIHRLNLCSPSLCEMRLAAYEDYLKGDVTQSYLQRKSPFVWYEAKRQGLL